MQPAKISVLETVIEIQEGKTTLLDKIAAEPHTKFHLGLPALTLDKHGPNSGLTKAKGKDIPRITKPAKQPKRKTKLLPILDRKGMRWVVCWICGDPTCPEGHWEAV